MALSEVLALSSWLGGSAGSTCFGDLSLSQSMQLLDPHRYAPVGGQSYHDEPQELVRLVYPSGLFIIFSGMKSRSITD